MRVAYLPDGCDRIFFRMEFFKKNEEDAARRERPKHHERIPDKVGLDQLIEHEPEDAGREKRDRDARKDITAQKTLPV